MNPLVENTFESITEERLDFLESVGSGELFLCDGTETSARFIQETVANILSGDAKHIVIYFRRTVPMKKAKHIAKHISRAVKAADTTKKIETIYAVPTDLFALLKKETHVTEEERSIAVHAFLKQLDALRRVLPMKANLFEYLERNLKGWDRAWIEEAIAYTAESEKEWEIPIIITMDATERLKRLVQQVSRMSN